MHQRLMAPSPSLALASRDVIALLPRFRLPDNPDAEQMLQERMFTIQAFGIMFMLRRSEHVFSKSGRLPTPQEPFSVWGQQWVSHTLWGYREARGRQAHNQHRILEGRPIWFRPPTAPRPTVPTS